MTTKKTVTILIADADLNNLKTNNYKICFAKKVGSEFNVVWQSSVKYLAQNTFSWTPMFQLFGSNDFGDGTQVKVSTNSINISLGEMSTLSKRVGELSPPSSDPTNPDSIVMVNNYGDIHPGVKQLATNIDGTQSATPIYVSQTAIVDGKAILTPREEVMVWFEKNIETSTMFVHARSNSVVIDLTSVDTAVRKYANQTWSTPAAGELQDDAISA